MSHHDPNTDPIGKYRSPARDWFASRSSGTYNETSDQIIQPLQKKMMRSRIAEIAFGIGSLILGGVIGAVVENQINSGLSAAYFAILVLAIVAFIIIVLMFSLLKDEEANDRQVLSAISDIEKRLGFDVVYQDLKDTHGTNTKHDDYLAKLMHDAEFEILEISRSEVHMPLVNPDLAPSDVRQKYYDSILKRVEFQTTKGIAFVYKRICQFPEENGVFRSLGDRIYVDHCKQMVTLNQAKGIRSYVKRTLISSPISFLIIDRKHLVISVDAIRRVENANEQHIKGEIIITDPQKELIQVFFREWEWIENSRYTKTVALDDF